MKICLKLRKEKKFLKICRKIDSNVWHAKAKSVLKVQASAMKSWKVVEKNVTEFFCYGQQKDGLSDTYSFRKPG